jgi:hypothetical protein
MMDGIFFFVKVGPVPSLGNEISKKMGYWIRDSGERWPR